MESRPEVSVIVPTLGDAGPLASLLADLSAQEGVRLQVVVADGTRGSEGDERGCLHRPRSLPVRIVRTEAGRGRQMNEGARHAEAPDLLFLHADTRLEDRFLLSHARDHLATERARAGSDRVAGHFPVRFLRADRRRSLAYHFFEAKTCLDRPDCVNGDQGMWLSARWFEELARFDETLPFLEDARLAEKVAAEGAWTRLPGRLATSARRFEAEGLARRQTVNVLVRAFLALGDSRFFETARGLYRAQTEAGGLDPLPFFEAAERLLGTGPPTARRLRWRRAGTYAWNQSWQLALWVDALREWRAGAEPGSGGLPCFVGFSRMFQPVSGNAVGQCLARAAAHVWFRGTLAWLRFRRRRTCLNLAP